MVKECRVLTCTQTNLSFLCSPGLHAQGMVVPAMDWALLYQLPTQINPQTYSGNPSVQAPVSGESKILRSPILPLLLLLVHLSTSTLLISAFVIRIPLPILHLFSFPLLQVISHRTCLLSEGQQGDVVGACCIPQCIDDAEPGQAHPVTHPSPVQQGLQLQL